MEGLGHNAQKFKLYPIRNGEMSIPKTSLKVIHLTHILVTTTLSPK